jgi:hypothetical protein
MFSYFIKSSTSVQHTLAFTNVFEASPSRRLGDKACSRAWASGSPQPQPVWRPPNQIRRRVGVDRRRADAYSRAADAGC